MKKYFFPLVAFLILSSGCKKDEIPVIQNPEEVYLIDKVYDYHNNLVAEYIYDEQNRLIQRKTTDVVNQRSSDYFLEYGEKGLSQIIYKDYNMPVFDHEISLIYNSEGKVHREETYQRGSMISYINYAFDSKGRVVSFYKDDNKHFLFFNYDANGSVVSSKYIIDVSNDPFYEGKDTIEVHRYFKYDDKKTPNVNLSAITQFEILPYFGTEATQEKGLSAHNMTEFVNSTKWIYTYNEAGLPLTIETKWKDIITDEPMMLRFTYKKVE